MPNKSAPKPRRRNLLAAPVKFQYKPQWGVIVVCPSEHDQQQTYERLSSMGLTVKVVCV